MACPASSPGMFFFAVRSVIIRPLKEFTEDALEEAVPDLAW
jgi:hypothetical protein